MNINRHIGATVSAIAAGTVILAAPHALDALAPQAGGSCPAIDTVPICDITGRDSHAGSGGSEVTRRPSPSSNRVDPDFGCVVWEWHPFILCPG